MGIIVCAFALPLTVLAVAVTYTKRTVDGSYLGASHAVGIDFDLDGDIDIATTAYQDGDASWYRNNGSQSFTEVTIDGSLGAPIKLQVVDLDDDSDLDMVVADYGSADLIWYENNGSMSFAAKQNIDTTISGVLDFFAVDFSGDGNDDLVATGRDDNTFAWYKNDGSESFTQIAIDTTLSCPYNVHAGDLDGDGDQDIISHSTCDNDVFWYKNSGTGSFTKIAIDTNLSNPRGIHIADIDDDGDRDFVISAAGASDVMWYRNSGTGSFTRLTVDSSIAGAHGVYVADADDDGDKDILSTAQTDQDLIWYDNDGSETFTERNIDTTAGYPYWVMTVDMDKDGDTDVVSADYNGGDVMWYEQSGTGAPDYSSFSPADNATSVSATADLVITFDIVARAGTGSLTIKKTSDDSTVETITVSGALLSGNGSTQLTFNPSTTLAESTSYYINWTANAFKNTSGRHSTALTATTTWNFTTGDFTAPSASSFSPADDATSVETIADLVITFDQITRAGTGSLTIKKASDSSTIETITISGSQLSGNGSTQLTINPSVTLESGTSYYVNWTANAFKDTSRNHTVAVTAATTWNFTTAAPAATGGASRNAADRRTESMATESEADGGMGGGSADESAAITPVPAFVPVYTSQGKIFDESLRSIEETALTRTAQRAAEMIGDRFRRGLDTFRLARETIRDTLKSAAPASDDSRRQDRADRKVADHASDTADVAEREGYLVAQVGSTQVTYRDVPVASWYAPYVSAVITDEIATGYADSDGNPTGEFGAAAPVTYAEILAMAMRAQKTDLTGMRPPRNDSAQGTWAAPYVAAAEQNRLPGITPDLEVHSSATRGDVVALVLAILQLPVADQKPEFTDVPDDHPHAQAIATAKFYGIVQGDTAFDGTALGTFRPDEAINRAEVAKMIATLKEIFE